MSGITWIDAAPEFEIDGDGVSLTIHSGDQSSALRISRHNFRHFVEKGRRMLDAADREQEIKIVSFASAKRKRRGQT